MSAADTSSACAADRGDGFIHRTGRADPAQGCTGDRAGFSAVPGGRGRAAVTGIQAQVNAAGAHIPGALDRNSGARIATGTAGSPAATARATIVRHGNADGFGIMAQTPQA